MGIEDADYGMDWNDGLRTDLDELLAAEADADAAYDADLDAGPFTYWPAPVVALPPADANDLPF